jgi:hypothetical protein
LQALAPDREKGRRIVDDVIAGAKNLERTIERE